MHLICCISTAMTFASRPLLSVVKQLVASDAQSRIQFSDEFDGDGAT
jgi:hypothetical protein